ncbi:hypothetical protein KIPB_016318, partial [Kipferlia bialata]|eukprot:g16318.t1
MDSVMKEVKKLLCGSHITLVGQSVQNDIDWLGLKKGVDYGGILDLAQ